MPKLPLSISIIAMNEEANLRRCLNSAAEFASEIVVVDSGSKDKTGDVAREFGARVQHQDWLGYRDQKQVAMSLCTQPWVLGLDCDEVLSEELKQSILRFFESGDADRYDGAFMNRRTWFMKRWIRHGDWYPDRKLRLFKREKARSGGNASHDKVELAGTATQLKGDLLHYSFRDTSHYLSKQIQFSDEFLVREREAGRGFSLFKAIARPLWRFFRAYILRMGFLDGFAGLWIAAATGFFAFVRYSRTFEDRPSSDA